MQKQANDLYPIRYEPITLAEEFPILVPGKHSPNDSIEFFHTHEYLELGICYEGSGIFVVDGRIFDFKAGDVSIIFKNQIHIACSETGKLSVWEFTSLDILKLLETQSIKDIDFLKQIIQNGYNCENIITADKHPELVNLLNMVFQELLRQENGYKSSVKGLLWSFFIKFARVNKIGEDISQASISPSSLEKVTPALNYIYNNYMNEIYSRDLALLCCISEAHFRRVFKTALHHTPSEYIIIVKIKMASILLSNSYKSILEISNTVGFNSLSSFNRNFKSLTGASPMQWRKNR
ncbi:MAG TPA: AraC family transcriptional regulator [Clostridiaceae bacterium]